MRQTAYALHDNGKAPEFPGVIPDDQILAWYDRPILFHAQDHLQRPWLAYLVDVAPTTRLSKFLFVPTSQGLVDDLAARRKTLHAVLTGQASFGWTAWETPRGDFVEFERVALFEIPPTSLPDPAEFLCGLG